MNAMSFRAALMMCKASTASEERAYREEEFLPPFMRSKRGCRVLVGTEKPWLKPIKVSKNIGSKKKVKV